MNKREEYYANEETDFNAKVLEDQKKKKSFNAVKQARENSSIAQRYLGNKYDA